jgi:ABC-type spermidine/putrescine transport system permease subunit II
VPPAGMASLAIAAFNAGLAVLIGAWAGRWVTRLGDRVRGGDAADPPP